MSDTGSISKYRREVESALDPERTGVVEIDDRARIGRLADAARELGETVTGEHAFALFLVDYLQEYEGDACGCPYDYCDVTQRELPAAIRTADDPVVATNRYLQEHPAAHALRDARDAYQRKRNAWRRLWRRAWLATDAPEEERKLRELELPEADGL